MGGFSDIIYTVVYSIYVTSSAASNGLGPDKSIVEPCSPLPQIIRIKSATVRIMLSSKVDHLVACRETGGTHLLGINPRKWSYKYIQRLGQADIDCVGSVRSATRTFAPSTSLEQPVHREAFFCEVLPWERYSIISNQGKFGRRTNVFHKRAGRACILYKNSILKLDKN